MLKFFNIKDSVDNSVKLLLKDLTKDKIIRKHSVFNLKAILIVFSIDIIDSNKKKLFEELKKNNNNTIKKSLKHFLHFFKNRLHLTDLILNLIFNLNNYSLK